MSLFLSIDTLRPDREVTKEHTAIAAASGVRNGWGPHMVSEKVAYFYALL